MVEAIRDVNRLAGELRRDMGALGGQARGPESVVAGLKSEGVSGQPASPPDARRLAAKKIRAATHAPRPFA